MPAAAEDRDPGAEQVGARLASPGARAGVGPEVAQPGQGQRERVLGDRLGVHALAARPGALGVGPDDVDVGLDPRPRELDPVDVPGGRRAARPAPPDRRGPSTPARRPRPASTIVAPPASTASPSQLRVPSGARAMAERSGTARILRTRLGAGGPLARFSKHIGPAELPLSPAPSPFEAPPSLRTRPHACHHPRPHALRHRLRHGARDHGPGGQHPDLPRAHEGPGRPATAPLGPAGRRRRRNGDPRLRPGRPTGAGAARHLPRGAAGGRRTAAPRDRPRAAAPVRGWRVLARHRRHEHRARAARHAAAGRAGCHRRHDALQPPGRRPRRQPLGGARHRRGAHRDLPVDALRRRRSRACCATTASSCCPR